VVNDACSVERDPGCDQDGLREDVQGSRPQSDCQRTQCAIGEGLRADANPLARLKAFDHGVPIPEGSCGEMSSRSMRIRHSYSQLRIGRSSGRAVIRPCCRVVEAANFSRRRRTSVRTRIP
jgi:hypothetical protein